MRARPRKVWHLAGANQACNDSRLKINDSHKGLERPWIVLDGGCMNVEVLHFLTCEVAKSCSWCVVAGEVYGRILRPESDQSTGLDYDMQQTRRKNLGNERFVFLPTSPCVHMCRCAVESVAKNCCDMCCNCQVFVTLYALTACY